MYVVYLLSTDEFNVMKFFFQIPSIIHLQCEANENLKRLEVIENHGLLQKQFSR